jgi:hypothetical protein
MRSLAAAARRALQLIRRGVAVRQIVIAYGQRRNLLRVQLSREIARKQISGRATFSFARAHSYR